MPVPNDSAAVEIERTVALAKASLADNLARNKFGMAIAANKAMIATTIMISTNVNPLDVFLIIQLLKWRLFKVMMSVRGIM